MLWQLFNNITGNHYWISCVLLIVLGIIIFLYHYDFADSTSSFTAAFSGYMYPVALMLTEVNTISEFKGLADEILFAGVIFELIFLMISIINMPCFRRKGLESPISHFINVLIVLGYYSFGMIIGSGIRFLNLSKLLDSRSSFTFIQGLLVAAGAFVILLAASTYTDKERREELEERINTPLK